MALTPEAVGYSHDDDPGEPSTGKPRLSISDHEATILSALGAGRRVLEIGTGLGVSTRALAWKAEMVSTVDVDPWVERTIAPDLNFLPNVMCFQDRFAVRDTAFDLVFIDADHTTDAVRADIEHARYVADTYNGFIVCHDARYANVSLALPEGHLFLDTEHGLAVFPAS